MPRTSPSIAWAVMARTACACLALLVALAPGDAMADARSQAKRIHDRLAGVPPTEAVLTSMASDVAAGRAVDAAYTAMEHRAFYDVTLKNFAMPWTNRAVPRATALSAATLPERQAYPVLYDALAALLDAICLAPSARGWTPALLSFELLLLRELGYGEEQHRPESGSWPG